MNMNCSWKALVKSKTRGVDPPLFYYQGGNKMNQHTPGPWKAYPDGIQTFVASIPSGRVVAMDLYDENSDSPIEEIEANARLIAAAPGLLDAAETAVEIIRDSYGQHDVDVLADCQAVNVLEQAIKEAKGGSHG